MIAGSVVPCSIQPPGETQRRTREVLPEARRPRELRGRLEGGAALIELARLAVGLTEAEPQVAAGRLVGVLGKLEGLERAVEVTGGLLVRERRERLPGRAGREVDRFGRRSGLGGRDEVVRKLAERRLGSPACRCSRIAPIRRCSPTRRGPLSDA